MKSVILGCGRVGARLATLMENEGHEVTIIDSDPNAFERLSGEFQGRTVLGTGIDIDVLKSAGIEEAESFAAVTNYDNTNIMACEIAKEIFGVRKVLARIYDPGRESFYHELGLDTVCPTTLISTTVHDILLSPDHVHPPGSTVHDPEVAEPVLPTLALTDDAVVPANLTQGLASQGAVQTPGDGAGAAQSREQEHENENQRHNARGLRGLFRP